MTRKQSERVSIEPRIIPVNRPAEPVDQQPIRRPDGTVIDQPIIPEFDVDRDFWGRIYPVLKENKKWFKLSLAVIGDFVAPNTTKQLLTLIHTRKTMTTQNRIKKFLYNLTASIRQVYWPYDVFEKDDNGKIVYTGKYNSTKPVVHAGWSVLAKLLSLILASYGTVELLGIPVANLLNILVELI